jgi:glutamine synthetase
MKDLEIQALELAIPCKTRHNEVAPNQFELAPIFEECNLAVDHNMLLMSLMKRVARKHGFRVLLHEKPFDGINGSGKHNNWSLTAEHSMSGRLQDEKTTLLHAPGKTPEENLRFVTFIVETLMGVYRHNGLLKASIMSATNAHRLGGNEAPPAIISSFLGKQLTELLDHIEQSDKNELFNLKGKQGMEIDIPQIPDLIIDNTDRNRTSPFAFTGNRFEFRAPGSTANCASAMIALNSAMAEALQDFKLRVDEKIANGENKLWAILDVLRDDIKTCKPIRFDGNGYSDEWVVEAARRGLDVEKSCPVIFEHYLDPESIRMFESVKVMNRKELAARNEVKWETYVKTVQIEARVMGDLSMNHIIPVSTHYQSQLIKNVQGMKDVFPAERAERLSARNMKLIEEIAERTERIEQLVEELTEARRVANRIADIHQRAIAYHDTVCPKMAAIRNECDHLEMIVEDGLWTLPKYRELLFIR